MNAAMNRRPIVVADANLALAESLFGSLSELRLLPGREIRRSDIMDADTLLVRSVTRVDRALLEGSRVRFVGSATIGADHLDLDYLRVSGIPCVTAPGCNAQAVVDYVCSAIAVLPGLLERLLAGGTAGIIGGGNVGARLARRLREIGIAVRVVDPWLQPPQPWPLVGMDALERCDLICVHVPLIHGGPYPTHHLLGVEQLSRLRPGAVLINAGRGAVIDEQALGEHLAGGGLTAVLDVWEHEPRLSASLVEQVALATPHIAGYSDDGKLAGSLAIWRAWCRWRGVEPAPVPSLPAAPPLVLPPGLKGLDLVRAACLEAYDIRRDDRALRRVIASGEEGGFDRLRREYPLRREYAVRPLPENLPPSARQMLQRWGLGVATSG